LNDQNSATTQNDFNPIPSGVTATTDGFRLLLQQQMKDFLALEGFPDAEDWTPRWRIVQQQDGYKAGFIDQKSVDWYNKRMGTNLKVEKMYDPGREKEVSTAGPSNNNAEQEPKLNRAQRRAAQKKLKSKLKRK